MSWDKVLIPPGASIHDAIEAIDRGSLQICLVVDTERRLLGTVTDGDIRRAILSGMDMGAPAEGIMYRTPHVGREGDAKETLLARMAAEKIRQIPLLDGEGRVVGLAYIDDLLSPPKVRENWVVLMAGGMGTRLRPLTESAPKPLLTVGDKPLLETILESFIEQNFKRFYKGLEEYQDQLILPTLDPRSDPSWFGFPITTKNGASRQELVQWLESANIETRQVFAGNILRQPAYKNIRHRVHGTLEESDRVMRDTFFIGVYPGLTDEMAAFILTRFKEFFAASRSSSQKVFAASRSSSQEALDRGRSTDKLAA